MRLVTYFLANEERVGLECNEQILDLERGYAFAKSFIHGHCESLPSTILDYLRAGETAHREARKLAAWFASNHHAPPPPMAQAARADVRILAPVPRPVSMRDGYAFRQHVETARRNRGLDMIDVFDQIPIFYFTNHLSVTGEGEVEVQELHLQNLDFELECAIVIGKGGKNISAQTADEHIYGFTVMNDWSARALQMQEMQMSLGPAKGKDFATSLGPALVSKESLHDRIIPTPNGNRYDLPMTASINGKIVSRGNVKDMHWTFAQIIERASYGVELHPGEVIGSGTCGTGCLLELNGSKVFDPPLWLKDGDEVECAIEGVCALRNTVRLARA